MHVQREIVAVPLSHDRMTTGRNRDMIIYVSMSYTYRMVEGRVPGSACWQPCWGKTLGLSRAMFGATALERGSPATSEGRGGEKHRPTTRALLMLEGRGPPRALGDTHGGLGQVFWRSDR